MLNRIRKAAGRKNQNGDGDEDEREQDERGERNEEEEGVELGGRGRRRRRAEGKEQEDEEKGDEEEEEEGEDGEQDGLLDRQSGSPEGKDQGAEDQASTGKKSFLSKFTAGRRSKAKKGKDGDEEGKGDEDEDEDGGGDEDRDADGGDGTRKSKGAKSMLNRFRMGRKDREDAIEEKKADEDDGEDEGEDNAVEDKNQKRARARAKRRENERKRREARAKAENRTSYKPPQSPLQWCCNAANMLSLNAYVTCVVAVFGCQVLCVLEGQCFDKTNNPAVQKLVNWFSLPLVAIVLFNGLVGLQAAEAMRTIEKLRKTNAENHDEDPVSLFGYRMVVRVFAILSIVTAFILFLCWSALLAELTTGQIRARVRRKWDNEEYGTKATTFYEDADALADEKIVFTGHTFMFAFFGMAFQGFAFCKATWFLIKDHCCTDFPAFRKSAGAGRAEEET